MLHSLLDFLLGSPEEPIPYPWDRCYDRMGGILYYRNGINGCVVFDLRLRVNLGGGLVYVNNTWGRDFILSQYLLNRRSRFRRYFRIRSEPPVFFHATCFNPLVYMIVPGTVRQCPLCFGFIHFDH